MNLSHQVLSFSQHRSQVLDYWKSVQDAAIKYNYFQTYDFFIRNSSLPFSDCNTPIELIVIFDCDQAIAILPFFTHHTPFFKIFYSPFLGLSDYWSPLISFKYRSSDLFHTYLAFLLSKLYYVCIPYASSSCFHAYTFTSSFLTTQTSTLFKSSVRYYILPSSLEQFTIKHAKTLKKFRQVKRKTIISDDSSVIEKTLSLSFHLFYKSLQSSRTGARSLFKRKYIFDKLMGILFSYNTAVSTLYDKDKNIVATGFHFTTPSVFTYYQPSYLPKSKIYSPGRMLLIHLILNSLSRGREFDFSLGDEDYKKNYAMQSEDIYALFHLPLILVWLFPFIHLFYSFSSRNSLRKLYQLMNRFIS